MTTCSTQQPLLQPSKKKKRREEKNKKKWGAALLAGCRSLPACSRDDDARWYMNLSTWALGIEHLAASIMCRMVGGRCLGGRGGARASWRRGGGVVISSNADDDDERKAARTPQAGGRAVAAFATTRAFATVQLPAAAPATAELARPAPGLISATSVQQPTTRLSVRQLPGQYLPSSPSCIRFLPSSPRGGSGAVISLTATTTTCLPTCQLVLSSLLSALFCCCCCCGTSFGRCCDRTWCSVIFLQAYMAIG